MDSTPQVTSSGQESLSPLDHTERVVLHGCDSLKELRQAESKDANSANRHVTSKREHLPCTGEDGG